MHVQSMFMVMEDEITDSQLDFIVVILLDRVDQ